MSHSYFADNFCKGGGSNAAPNEFFINSTSINWLMNVLLNSINVLFNNKKLLTNLAFVRTVALNF